MPPVSLWSVYVSLTAPEQTHTQGFLSNTHSHTHTWLDMVCILFTVLAHMIHYLQKSHVQKVKPDDCIHVPHTDSLTDFRS